MSAGQWAFWIAVAAFVAGAGKFLDENHIGAKHKSAARGALIRMFLWLDQRTVPDLGGPLLQLGRRLYGARKTKLVLLALAFSYWATLTAFYLGREFLGPPNTEGYLSYLVGWIPADRSASLWIRFLLVLAIPALLGLAFVAYCFHRASVAKTPLVTLGLLAAGIAGSAAISLVGAAIALRLENGGGYAVPILVVASLASVLVPGAFACVTIALLMCRIALRAAQYALLQVFNVASSPEKSPFTYASSLLSVCVLGFKVFQELFTVAK